MMSVGCSKLVDGVSQFLCYRVGALAVAGVS